MIYDSLDIIPAKLYFKIEQTEDVNLLSTEKTNKDLSILWEKLKEDYQLLNPDKANNQIIDLSKKMESLFAKFEATKLSVFHLKNKKDQDLIDLLKSYGYKLDLNKYQTHLDIIEKENKALLNKINTINEKLERLKPKQNGNTTTTFDEVVLSYSSLTNAGFIDTNKITITQYNALINLGNKKIKELEKNGKR